MADRKPVESLDDLSPKALGELKAWFESWYRQHPTDATVNQGVNYGVRSVNLTSGDVTEGYVLTATGVGGSRWDPPLSTGGCPTLDDITAEAVVRHAGGLVGWWKLGDGSSPWADSNGTYTPADATKTTSSGWTAMTDLITGAIAGGDGAVQFNDTDGLDAEYLHAPEASIPGRFNLTTNQTVMAWVKPGSSASSFPGYIVDAIGDSGFGGCGWALYIQWPGVTPVFYRRESGSPADTDFVMGTTIPTDSWTHLVGVYDTVLGMNLYIDGVSAGTAGPTTITMPTFNGGVNIGALRMGTPGAAGFGAFYGGIDEIQLWNVAFDESEVLDFFRAGLPCADIPGGSEVAGQVPTSNGDGTSSWEFPEIASYVNGT